MLAVFGFDDPLLLRVAVPVGALCWCGEPIEAEDAGYVAGSMVAHLDCRQAQLVGSVGHQLRLCACFGGTLEDPPGLSPRDAARAAVAVADAFKILPEDIAMRWLRVRVAATMRSRKCVRCHRLAWRCRCRRTLN